MKSKNIVLGVTASIAIYKACEIVRSLVQNKIAVNVVMTENAIKLISPQVFASLSGTRVYIDEFTDPNNWDIEHIALSKKAGLVLIAPATANIIGKIANGIADDLLSTTTMASRAPVLIAPAMNDNMYKNRIVNANIQKLKSMGYKFIGPDRGKLACGDMGIGHLAEVKAIVKEVKQCLK